jgi:hypothetical protein
MYLFLPSRHSKVQVFAGDAGAAAEPATDSRGFTPADLEALDQVRGQALRNGRWTRAEIVRDFALDYLAAWSADGSASASPSLAVIRFKKSGTYALTVGSTMVATARCLAKILPAVQGLSDPRGPLVGRLLALS